MDVEGLTALGRTVIGVPAEGQAKQLGYEVLTSLGKAARGSVLMRRGHRRTPCSDIASISSFFTKHSSTENLDALSCTFESNNACVPPLFKATAGADNGGNTKFARSD